MWEFWVGVWRCVTADIYRILNSFINPLLDFYLLSSQILMYGSSGSVLNSPERFLPRRPLTCSVAPKSSLVLRSKQMLILTLLSAVRLTAPTTRPAPARWVHPLTRWQSSTRTRGSLVLSSCVWSTPPSCLASLAATWTHQPSWWQRRLPTSSEVAHRSLTQGFPCTDHQHSKHRDDYRQSKWYGMCVIRQQQQWTTYYALDGEQII